MQITKALRDGIMAGIIETGNILDPAAVFVGVFQSVNDLQLDTTLADLTEATGAMATRLAVTTWGTPYTMVDGRRVVDAPAKVFTPASAAESQALAGWFIATAAVAGTLLGFGLFPQNFNMIDENSHATVVVRITVDPSGRWSAEEVWNG